MCRKGKTSLAHKVFYKTIFEPGLFFCYLSSLRRTLVLLVMKGAIANVKINPLLFQVLDLRYVCQLSVRPVSIL